MVARTVEQYIRAGVAGAHLEDQVRIRWLLYLCPTFQIANSHS